MVISFVSTLLKVRLLRPFVSVKTSSILASANFKRVTHNVSVNAFYVAYLLMKLIRLSEISGSGRMAKCCARDKFSSFANTPMGASV